MKENNVLTIRIDRVKPFSQKTLQAFIDFTILNFGIKINDCAVHSKDGERWIRMPAREYSTPEGKQWHPIVTFVSREAHDALNEVVLQAFDRFVEKAEEKDEEAW
jgi:DNA-binding cell septation regulator SpoVG